MSKKDVKTDIKKGVIMKIRINKNTSKNDLLLARDVLDIAMREGFERKLIKGSIEEGFDIEFKEKQFNVKISIYDNDEFKREIIDDLKIIEELLYQKEEDFKPVTKIVSNFKTNKKPTEEMIRKSDILRLKIMDLANHIYRNIYDTEEKYKAIEQLELVQMYCNKAIFHYDRRDKDENE